MFQGDLNVEKLRIEQHFHQLKEDKMRSLLDRLNSQERIRLDDMIDKQTHEMLRLIDKRVSGLVHYGTHAIRGLVHLLLKT